MRSSSLGSLGRVLALVATLVVLCVIFLVGVRPWHLRWGATRAEAAATLIGDEVLSASAQSTRAITIAAPAARVWAWVTQLGQDRGGFYSYELLEDLAGTSMENVDELRPELQRWKVGDKLWMYPPDKLGGAGHALLLRIEPERALVFGTRRIGTGPESPHDGSWAFLVRPLGPEQTRLIVRSRAAGTRSLALTAFDVMVFEPMHFVMERKMMEGIAARAEGHPPSAVFDGLEVAMFAVCFALFGAAVVRLVRWPRALPEVLMVLATGITFQLLTFVQPPWIVGCLLVPLLSMYVGGGSFGARAEEPASEPTSMATGTSAER